MFYNKRRRITVEDLKAGVWLPVYALAMLMLSYLSDTTYLRGGGIIPFPWDNLVFVAVSLAFFYWGYLAGLKHSGRGTLD